MLRPLLRVAGEAAFHRTAPGVALFFWHRILTGILCRVPAGRKKADRPVNDDHAASIPDDAGNDDSCREHLQVVAQSQRQWMAVIDAMTDYVFVLDDQERIVKVNTALAQSVGRHPRELIGASVREVLGDAVAQEVLIRETPDGRTQTCEKTIGAEAYQISVFPLREDDRVLRVHVMKNVTEVKRLKDQLYHADKLASIGLLVSGVAHEINNPLTGTIAYTELLRMKVKDEEILAQLKKILDCSERCKKIVENLLTFSRQRMPSKSIESITTLIDRAIELRIYWLRSNNIAVERRYDENASVFVDGQQIQQVILNILMNAEQAITGVGMRDGRIIFTTRADKARRTMQITIENNGPPIPQNALSRIFDPFFTTKPVGIGTGLGLSISHGIISEHGGTITAANTERGVSFSIELPAGAPVHPDAGKRP
jgi:PAS domain S-box-containing protein